MSKIPTHKHYPARVWRPSLPPDIETIVPEIQCDKCRAPLEPCECVHIRPAHRSIYHYIDVPEPGCQPCGGSGWVRES